MKIMDTKQCIRSGTGTKKLLPSHENKTCWFYKELTWSMNLCCILIKITETENNKNERQFGKALGFSSYWIKK